MNGITNFGVMCGTESSASSNGAQNPRWMFNYHEAIEGFTPLIMVCQYCENPRTKPAPELIINIVLWDLFWAIN